MEITLYNTASRKKEKFVPLNSSSVKMYTCGPTVYHYVHIGNYRTFIFEDLLRRTLKFFGYSLTHAMNLTDVDDKTIRGAIARGVSLEEYTKPYKEAFFQDLNVLNIEAAQFYPAATDHIQEMIRMIEVLLAKGIAYRGGDGSVYYALHKFPRYGCLSHLHLDELQAGACERVASDEYEKDHVADFVLWKHYDPARDGQIFWESPFGPGRPGWHLECSAMAIKILGETVDIHAGGIDNMFPHHENEIAQSEAYSGKVFSNFWMHAEHLVVDGKKMSKSLGNFYTLRDLLDRGFTGMQIRYLLLQTHYKTQLNFTFQGLEAAKNSLQRLNDFIQRLHEVDGSIEGERVRPLIDEMLKEFKSALGDDLNISVALAALFDFVRELNGLCDQGQVGRQEAGDALTALKEVNQVLGLLTFDRKEDAIPNELQEAFQQRLQARQDKNWALADQLRDFIHESGYYIEDTPQGARLKKH